MNSPAIEVQSLKKTYRQGLFKKLEIEALKDVSFSVERGSIFGLLGPNGAGKTTLIKVLLGLVRRTDGDAKLLGKPAGHRSGRACVGYLPEHHRIPRHLTGNSALNYYGGLSGMSPAQINRQREVLLERVGLADWGKTSVKKYSKGMLQRLGLAQAMLHEPEVLILDEPTDGVDPVGRTEMRAILQRLKHEGKTVFINSHLLQEVELVCDRVAILSGGLLQKIGTVEELTASEKSEVRFTVHGDEATVRQAVATLELSDWAPLSSNRIGLKIAAEDQDTVNQAIDLLRAAEIDILSVVPARNSLEEAFLGVVTKSKTDGARTRSASDAQIRNANG